jgi:hypothetical protein
MNRKEAAEAVAMKLTRVKAAEAVQPAALRLKKAAASWMKLERVHLLPWLFGRRKDWDCRRA